MSSIPPKDLSDLEAIANIFLGMYRADSWEATSRITNQVQVETDCTIEFWSKLRNADYKLGPPRFSVYSEPDWEALKDERFDPTPLYSIEIDYSRPGAIPDSLFSAIGRTETGRLVICRYAEREKDTPE